MSLSRGIAHARGSDAIVIGGQRAWQLHTDDGVPRDGEPGHPARENGPQRAHVGPESRLRAGAVPHKRGLARWRNGRWVDRQLQVPQDLLDDTALGNRRDDPQRALLTPRAARHSDGKHPLEQPRPTPVRGRGAGVRLFQALLAWRRDEDAASAGVVLPPRRICASPCACQDSTRRRTVTAAPSSQAPSATPIQSTRHIFAWSSTSGGRWRCLVVAI
jgi:hypothetical protein